MYYHLASRVGAIPHSLTSNSATSHKNKSAKVLDYSGVVSKPAISLPIYKSLLTPCFILWSLFILLHGQQGVSHVLFSVGIIDNTKYIHGALILLMCARQICIHACAYVVINDFALSSSC